MERICEVVQQVMKTGYLTVQAEAQMRQLLKTQCDLQDFNALMALREALKSGCVKSETFHWLGSGAQSKKDRCEAWF